MMADILEHVAFATFALMAIFGSLGTIYSKRIAHSMFWLIIAFLAVAGVFILAGAELLAAIQILVYLGSVMLVFAFGIMLARRTIQEGDV
jgi:NADH-quinone oxidoreductase subunit J